MPQGGRKKPFSGKQKKNQLAAKRVGKSMCIFINKLSK